MTILGFRKQELATCRSIASIATPPEYRLIYTHMAALGAERSGLNEESWVNKMTAMTIKVHERQYADRQASTMIQDILEDAAVKHMNFR